MHESIIEVFLHSAVTKILGTITELCEIELLLVKHPLFCWLWSWKPPFVKCYVYQLMAQVRHQDDSHRAKPLALLQLGTVSKHCSTSTQCQTLYMEI